MSRLVRPGLDETGDGRAQAGLDSPTQGRQYNQA